MERHNESRRSFLAAVAAAPVALVVPASAPAESSAQSGQNVQSAKTDTPPAEPLSPIGETPPVEPAKRTFQIVGIRRDGSEYIEVPATSEEDAQRVLRVRHISMEMDAELPEHLRKMDRLEAREIDLSGCRVAPVATDFPMPPRLEPYQEPRLTGRKHERKYKLADKLTKATDGVLEVEYSGKCWIDDDRTAQGHIFMAGLNNELVDVDCAIDDRDGDVAALLAADCLRVAKLWRKMARKLEGGVA